MFGIVPYQLVAAAVSLALTLGLLRRERHPFGWSLIVQGFGFVYGLATVIGWLVAWRYA